MTLISEKSEKSTKTKLPNLSPNAKIVLEKRYLKQNERGEVVETPNQLFERVAKAIAANEARYGGDPTIYEEKYHEMMINLEFLPNSPCFETGSPILTSFGYTKNIENIKVGDWIVSDDGSINKVIETFKREIREEVLKINIKKLPNSTLKVTKNHPILGLKNLDVHYPSRRRKRKTKAKPRWLYAGALEVGDYVAIRPYSYVTKDIDHILISNIIDDEFEINEDNEIILIHKRKTPTKGIGFWKKGYWIPNKIKINSDFMRLCGYWLAEGSLSIERKR
ncbi:MAG: ribonucleotide reductase N-terminal alpha domain-containing protein, partial [Candidatus Thorarchaeota archaeon]